MELCSRSCLEFLSSAAWILAYLLGAFAVGVGVLFGVIAIFCFIKVAMILSTVALGSYLVAIALNGLIPLFGGPTLPSHVYFEIWVVAAVIGFAFQYYLQSREKNGKGALLDK